MRAWCAIVASLVLHGLIAGAIALYMDYAPGPTVSAELDLSSVELSFADERAELAEPSPVVPNEVLPQPPKPNEKPPMVEPPKRLPPDPQGYKPPEPDQPSPDLRPTPAKPSKLVQARIDVPPKPVRAIRPEYPRGARRRGEQGSVVLEVEIGVDGRCAAASVAISSGYVELDAAAVKAVKAAHFSPAREGSRAVASSARLTLDFRLR